MILLPGSAPTAVNTLVERIGIVKHAFGAYYSFATVRETYCVPTLVTAH